MYLHQIPPGQIWVLPPDHPICAATWILELRADPPEVAYQPEGIQYRQTWWGDTVQSFFFPHAIGPDGYASHDWCGRPLQPELPWSPEVLPPPDPAPALILQRAEGSLAFLRLKKGGPIFLPHLPRGRDFMGYPLDRPYSPRLIP